MKTFVKMASILVLTLAVSNNLLLAQKKNTAAATDKTSAKAGDSKPEKTAEKPAEKTDKPKDPLENMRFRNLGPAVGGGRVTAVVGVPGKPGVYYAGAAAGGVFVTQDGG